MSSEKITPEKVEELYNSYNNKELFISMFSTTKFHLVSDSYLKSMYDFLIGKK